MFSGKALKKERHTLELERDELQVEVDALKSAAEWSRRNVNVDTLALRWCGTGR